MRSTRASRSTSSSRVPIVEPTTESCRKNTRLRSAGGFGPLVAPLTTTRPPGRSDRSECDQVASPTVSIDQVALGREARAGLHGLVGAELDRPAALLGVAGRAEHRVALRLGQQDRGAGHAPAGALHEHRGGAGEAGPGREHPVGGEVGGREARGLLEAEAGGLGHDVAAPARRPARPACRRAARTGACGRGSRVSSPPPAAGSPMTAWTTTSVPSSSTPAPSQPSTIGSRSAGSPTPAQRPQVVVVERGGPKR